MKCKSNNLTDKQEKFVQELIRGKSQRQAYYIAFPSSKKWKDTTVDAKASNLLKVDKVKARYDEMKGKVIDKVEQKSIVTAEQIIQELANIAFSNGTDFASVIEKEGMRVVIKDGEEFQEPFKYLKVELKPTNSIPDNKKSAIAGYKETRYGIEVKQHDKVKALELLGKHLNLFDDKEEDNKTINLIHTIPRPDKEE